eukprot:6731601-Alexandrium_andersonii.AAC.1
MRIDLGVPRDELLEHLWLPGMLHRLLLIRHLHDLLHVLAPGVPGRANPGRAAGREDPDAAVDAA